MIVGEGQGFDESTSDASTPDTGAAFGQDDSEFNIFNTDRQLSALQTAATMLGQINEKKSLIYFASGLRLNGVEQSGATACHGECGDPRGRFVLADRCARVWWRRRRWEMRPRVARRHRHVLGNAALAVTTNFQQSQDTLYALAADTGGKALLDNNDLTKGIVQAEQSVSSYYMIGYYPTNTALDGKFRRIKISLDSAG